MPLPLPLILSLSLTFPLVRQVNRVKVAMATGQTAILVSHDNIYEALYDVLNQRYLVKRDANGRTTRMLRLAIGSRSQLCAVHGDFSTLAPAPLPL